MKQMDGLDHPRNRQAVHRRSLFRANEDKIVIRQRICLQVKDAIVFRAPLDVHRLSREWTTCKVSIAAFMDHYLPGQRNTKNNGSDIFAYRLDLRLAANYPSDFLINPIANFNHTPHLWST